MLERAEYTARQHRFDHLSAEFQASRAALGLQGDGPTDGASEAEPDGQLIEPLSRRELEILQLIAQGCSNEEIGRKLFLALSTVKGHNRNMFDKLQVRRRTEAVALARKLGLIDAR